MGQTFRDILDRLVAVTIADYRSDAERHEAMDKAFWEVLQSGLEKLSQMFDKL